MSNNKFSNEIKLVSLRYPSLSRGNVCFIHITIVKNFMKYFLDMNISLPIIIVSDIPIVVVTNLSTLGALFRHLKSPLKNYFNSLLLEDLFIKIKRKPMSLRTELHRIIVTKYRSSRLQRYKNSFFL